MQVYVSVKQNPVNDRFQLVVSVGGKNFVSEHDYVHEARAIGAAAKLAQHLGGTYLEG